MSVGDTTRLPHFVESFGSILYRLALAFPSWAGAISSLYGFYLLRSGALKIRSRL